MKYLLLLHDKIGFANAPLYYVHCLSCYLYTSLSFDVKGKRTDERPYNVNQGAPSAKTSRERLRYRHK
jgi:hypothetical protein